MTRKPFLAIILVSMGLFASETVVKSSAPFSFPTTVGITTAPSQFQKGLSFNANVHCAGNKSVLLSWSLPGVPEKGTISIFSLSGSKIQTYSVNSRTGSVQWKLASDKKIAKGIYFARIMSGTYSKNIKLAIY
jgi:hypothetical protein